RLFGTIIVTLYPWLEARVDLHRFPARRSSDLSAEHQLRGEARAAEGAARRERRALRGRQRARAGAREPGHRDARARVHDPGVLRSEEHTSELQSRENLVCRLLLEKKKKMRKQK